MLHYFYAVKAANNPWLFTKHCELTFEEDLPHLPLLDGDSVISSLVALELACVGSEANEALVTLEHQHLPVKLLHLSDTGLLFQQHFHLPQNTPG